MTTWINLFSYIGIMLVLSVSYFADASVLVMTSLVFSYVITLFIFDRTQWTAVYLGIMTNLLFLWLAIWLMDGQVSFLTEESFFPYYKKSLLLETFFWATFSVLYRSSFRAFESEKIYILNAVVKTPIDLQYVTAIGILVLEIIISSNAYFKPYSEVSDTGTIAYEVGCLMLALAIVSRTEYSRRPKVLMLEMLGVGIALFIVLGSGKRLPFAYVIIAYLLYSLQHYGKFRTTLLYFAISGFGFLLGIVRDFMAADSVSAEMLAIGFGASNQGAVLHASAVYLRVADEGLSTLLDRVISFMSNFFGALLLPISLLPEQAQINLHAMKYYDVQGNGGFIGTYSYYFLGWIGPFFIATVLALLCARRGRIINNLIVIIILTSPRWTLYNIGPVLRLISMTLVVSFCVDFLYKLFKTRKKSMLRPA